jgi:cytoskeleton protein RodZ
MPYNEKELLDKLAAEKEAAVLPPKKETIGEILKNKRESLGKDIDYISEYLRIKPQYLKSLEADRFSSLPGQAYVVGFIKSYASFLGLDAARIIEQYKAENMLPAESADGLAPDENALIENPLINSNHIIVFGVLFLVVLCSLYIFRGGQRRQGMDADATFARESAQDSDNLEILLDSSLSHDGSAQDAARSPRPSEPQPGNASGEHIPFAGGPVVGGQEVSYEIEIVPDDDNADAPPSGQDVEAGEEAAAEPEAPHRPMEYGLQNRPSSRIKLLAKDKVWVKLKKDGFYVYDENDGDVGTGEVLFETILEPGDAYYVPDDDDTYLTIGNAQALDILVDGEAVKPLSSRAISRHNIEMDPEKLREGTAYVRRRMVE